LEGHDFYITFQVLAKLAGLERNVDALTPDQD